MPGRERYFFKEGFDTMRKVFAFLLILALSLTVASAAFAVTKVGVMTGTTSQGEEEYQAAQEMIRKYPGRIIHVTYPDKFMDEQETTIQQILSMAADPDVKAIVLVQGVPGSAAAIDKVKEIRPDMFFINIVPHEDPMLAAQKADIVLETDNPRRGVTIVDLAEKMGAKTFVHISFPRHMSYPLLAERRDIMKAECEKRGIEWVFVNAPDPTGDAGIAGAQQFILEDVPRQVEKYGKDTAFFSTNCGMQEPLIKSVLMTGAIYPEQCCPSPYHAYPGALGIEIPEGKAGDVAFILEAITEKVVEAGGAGRFATWKIPINMAFTYASVEYGFDLADGKIKGTDIEHMKKLLVKHAGESQFNTYNNVATGEKADNFLLVVGESIIFGGK
jgi:hypothetical protein